MLRKESIRDAEVETAKIKDAAVETAKIKDAAVETAKIKDGAVTPAKLSFTPGAGFVRRPDVIPYGTTGGPHPHPMPDKSAADFTCDGGYYADGLDLSGIIPAGAKAVVIVFDGRCTAVDKLFVISRHIDTLDNYTIKSYYANYMPQHQFVIACDPDRLFDYMIESYYDDFGLTVIGWFI
jgi:hypothetical protein